MPAAFNMTCSVPATTKEGNIFETVAAKKQFMRSEVNFFSATAGPRLRQTAARRQPCEAVLSGVCVRQGPKSGHGARSSVSECPRRPIHVRLFGGMPPGFAVCCHCLRLRALVFRCEGKKKPSQRNTTRTAALFIVLHPSICLDEGHLEIREEDGIVPGV